MTEGNSKQNNQNPNSAGAQTTGNAAALPPAKSDETLQNAWGNVRAIIKEENDIVNHRVTSFLAINGLAFTVVGLALTCYSNKSYSAPGRIGAVVVAGVAAILGYFSSRSTTPTIRAAFRQIHAANDWWNRFLNDKEAEGKFPYREAHRFPPTMGRGVWYFGKLMRGKQEKDDPYQDYGLQDGTTNPQENRLREYDNPAPYGLVRWPETLRKTWMVVGVLIAALSLWMLYDAHLASPVRRGSAETRIDVKVDPNTRRTKISFEGDLSRVPDLAAQIEPLTRQGP